MEAVEARAVIKYLHKKGMTPKEIHEDMMKTFGDDCPSYSTVKKWAASFKRGKESFRDEPRSGRPKTGTSDDQVEAIHRMVVKDRRVTVRHVAKSLGISFGSVHRVLTDNLGMSKVSARWVPRTLSALQKLNRLEMSRALLARFQSDPDNFLKRFVTQDETWIHHVDPESKQQSKQVSSAGKVMASVFWDSEGIIMIDYLQRGKTINAEYYASKLRQLRAAIEEKRSGKLEAGVLLLQGNAAVHTAQVSVAAANECGFELLPHPSYSPDLAPSDFYLFPKLTSHLRGKRFDGDDAVINAVEAYLGPQDASFFHQGIAMLEQRWTKCIEVRGDYVEK
ncbi:histone-lysine N-methyltransferase SETMAR-like [Branchiostoma floridae x Branchiostoma belcheri]